MITTIVKESKTLTEYARRAEAFDSVEAVPYGTNGLAKIWVEQRVPQFDADGKFAWNREIRKAKKAIKRAEAVRITKANAMWTGLIAGVDAEVES